MICGMVIDKGKCIQYVLCVFIMSLYLHGNANQTLIRKIAAVDTQAYLPISNCRARFDMCVQRS